jgi:hypothetical protein
MGMDRLDTHRHRAAQILPCLYRTGFALMPDGAKQRKRLSTDRRWLATNNASGIFNERLVVALFGDVIHQR